MLGTKHFRRRLQILCFCISGVFYQTSHSAVTVWAGDPYFATIQHTLDLQDKTGEIVNIVPFDTKNILLHARLANYLQIPPDFYLIPIDNLMFSKDLNLKEFDSYIVEEFPSLKIVSNGMGIALTENAPVLLYYNKRLVDKIPQTWQQLVNFREKDVLTIALSIDYLFNPLWYAFGMYDEQGVLQDNFSDALFKSMQEIKTLLSAKKIPTSCINEYCTGDKFAKGLTPFAIAGEWEYDYLHSVLGDDLGVMAFPSLNDKAMRILNLPMVLATTVSLPASQVKHGLMLAEYYINQNPPPTRAYPISPRVVIDSTWLAGCAFSVIVQVRKDYYTGEIDEKAVQARINKDFSQTSCESIQQ